MTAAVASCGSAAELKVRAQTQMFELIDELNTEYDRYIQSLIDRKRAITKKIFDDYLSLLDRISRESEMSGTPSTHQVKSEQLYVIKQENASPSASFGLMDDIPLEIECELEDDECDIDEGNDDDGNTACVKKYKCSYCACDYKTSNKHVMKLHEMRHRGEKPHKCSHCEYTAVTAQEVNRHTGRVHGHANDDIDGATTAQKTEFVPRTRKRKDSNSKNNTKEAKYKCGYCEYSTPRKHVLKGHEMRHRGEKPHKCSHCEYRAVARQQVVLHTQRRHARDCKATGHEQETECEDEVEVHEVAEEPAEDEAEDEAEDAATADIALDKETETIAETPKTPQSDAKLKKCRFCAYRTMSTPRLEVHEMRHRKEKPFKCGNCEYRAVTKWEISRHKQRVHAKQMKPSKSKTKITKCQRMHSPHGEQKCRYCDFSAVTKQEISLHELRLHAEHSKPFKCEKCEKRFAQRSHYDRHKQNARCS